jgi:putative ABC transport system permease protein
VIHLRVSRAFRSGIKSLLLHPMRSALTALSMLFGVGAVIAMLAVGEGASFQAQEQFRALGANTILIESAKRTVSKDNSNRNFVDFYGLTYADLERIYATVKDVEVSVPVRDFRKEIWHKARHYVDGRVVGTVDWFAEVQNYHLASGRWLGWLDNQPDRLNQVAVLGSDVAKTLFPLEDPLGQSISIGNNTFTVVGVMAPQAGGEQRKQMQLADLSKSVYVPLRTLANYFGKIDVQRTSGTQTQEVVELRQIIIRVPDVDQVLPQAAALANLLDRNHPDKDYRMVVPLKEIRQAQESARVFGFFLMCIGAISLFVGGIGIMNIMLATVTERTREIGIRRALGARKVHILTQFLVETLVLTMVGGLCGVAMGIASQWIIPTIYPGRIAIVTTGQVMVSFLISAGVGITFGIYPAWRAANMDPIEALRHE